MNDLALEVEQLCKTYDGVVALDHLSFHVQRGEIFGLLGPNGAGKTTTIRVLLNLIRPDSGHVALLGQPPGIGRERVGAQRGCARQVGRRVALGRAFPAREGDH